MPQTPKFENFGFDTPIPRLVALGGGIFIDTTITRALSRCLQSLSVLAQPTGLRGVSQSFVTARERRAGMLARKRAAAVTRAERRLFATKNQWMWHFIPFIRDGALP